MRTVKLKMLIVCFVSTLTFLLTATVVKAQPVVYQSGLNVFPFAGAAAGAQPINAPKFSRIDIPGGAYGGMMYVSELGGAGVVQVTPAGLVIPYTQPFGLFGGGASGIDIDGATADLPYPTQGGYPFGMFVGEVASAIMTNLNWVNPGGAWGPWVNPGAFPGIACVEFDRTPGFAYGGFLHISDWGNDGSDGIMQILPGGGVVPFAALPNTDPRYFTFDNRAGVSPYGANRLWVSSCVNGAVFSVTPGGGANPPLAVLQPGLEGLAFGPGDPVFGSDLYAGNVATGTIHKIAPDGTTTLFANFGLAGVGAAYLQFVTSGPYAIGGQPTLYVDDGVTSIWAITSTSISETTKWVQMPDETKNGIDIRCDDSDGFQRVLADDFKCISTGLITDVHFWGSWKNDIKGNIIKIHLSIHSDIPAEQSPTGYSMPNESPLWEKDFFAGDFNETFHSELTDPNFEWWWDPYEGQLLQYGDRQIYRYDIFIDPVDAFMQQGDPCNPVTYWLDISVSVDPCMPPQPEFGWKTSYMHWNDDAVYLEAEWFELRYPDNHPYHPNSIDMAFMITTEPPEPPKQPVPNLKWSQPPIPIEPCAEVPTYWGWDEPAYLEWLEEIPAMMGSAADGGRIAPLQVGGGKGYWDLFCVNLTPNGLYWNQVNGGNGLLSDPLVQPDPAGGPPVIDNATALGGVAWGWGGLDWGNGTLETNIGVHSIQHISAVSTPYFLSVVLDTNTSPNFDRNYPSWGLINNIVVSPWTGTGWGAPVAPQWILSPLDPDMGTVVTLQPGPATDIKLANNQWGFPENLQQPQGIWGAGAQLTSALGYKVDFTTDPVDTWDSYDSGPVTSPKSKWNMVADDWHCLGSMPVTSIHWWGSYTNWECPGGQGDMPPVLPVAWRFGFWSNVPAGLPPEPNYSHPETLLHAFTVPAARVEVEEVGCDYYCTQYPSDVCYQYYVDLDPCEVFWQDDFNDMTQDDIYWLSITAIYPNDVSVYYPWGWKTRPWSWNDDAVRFVLHEEPVAGLKVDPCDITPIKDPLWNESFDVAFELDTDPNYIKWEQPFTDIHHWPHYEDVNSMNDKGDPNIIVADDWRCERRTPVTAAVWWGSYIGYHYKAGCTGPWMPLPVSPDRFELKIWTDVATDDPDNTYPYSHPGEVIWQYDAFEYDEVLVGYDKHPHGAPNEPVFRYSVRIPDANWFRQPDYNRVFWLSVQAIYETNDPLYPWGWTNHKHTFNDDAVSGYTEPASGEWVWEELHDQTGKSADMSFILFTDPNVCSTCANYNTDWIINCIDYADFADDWLWVGPAGGYNNSDLNCDGIVSNKDLKIFALQWLTFCP